MSTKKVIKIINDRDDSKDLGDWVIDDERYHFILGAKCDRGAVEKAKAEGKKGPDSPEVEIPVPVWNHMKRESKAIQFWLDQREIYEAA
jgi:hypothetical protein